MNDNFPFIPDIGFVLFLFFFLNQSNLEFINFADLFKEPSSDFVDFLSSIVLLFASLQWDRRSSSDYDFCKFVFMCWSFVYQAIIYPAFSSVLPSGPSLGLIKSLSLHPHMNLCSSQLKLSPPFRDVHPLRMITSLSKFMSVSLSDC